MIFTHHSMASSAIADGMWEAISIRTSARPAPLNITGVSTIAVFNCTIVIMEDVNKQIRLTQMELNMTTDTKKRQTLSNKLKQLNLRKQMQQLKKSS